MHVSVEVLEPCPCSWFADMQNGLHNTVPGVGMLSLRATWASHANIWCTATKPMSFVIKLPVQSQMVECCEHKVSQMTGGLKRCTVSAPLLKNCTPQHVHHVSMKIQLTVMLSALKMHACVDQFSVCFLVVCLQLN